MALFFSFKKPDKYFGNRPMFFSIWIISSIVLLSLSAGKRPSYLLMLYPAAAALTAHFIVARVASYAEGAEQLSSIAFKWIVYFYTFVLSILLPVLSLLLIKTGHQKLAAGTAVLAVPLIFSIWRSAISRNCFCFVMSCASIIFVCFSGYYGWVEPEKVLISSARLIMENLSGLEKRGRPVVLFQPTERMEGAATYYLKHRVKTIASEGALVEVMSAQPNTIALVADPSTDRVLKLKELSQLSYGSIRYFYLTGY